MMLRIGTRLAGVAVLTVLTVGAAGTGVAHADGTTSQTSQASHSITAVGDGVVEGTPNVLELELGVTTRDPSAATALGHNSELAVKVLGELRTRASPTRTSRPRTCRSPRTSAAPGTMSTGTRSTTP
jgi:uncharacterized protein YggE